ncbi:hypothetical protein QBA57_27650 [Streptomyces scabiei]|uniref:hypothetical protein n=1 Tax=Streptomyces scabiei TaxID=1930 RepID=UPI001B30814E|nr:MULTISPECIES: hypothetical protein [Streptomyces]MDX2566339.1 hypothetical protein [Streptomyces scabiei]MDX3147074.1 hypothetical protein [Streptomyces scabiei]MDX3155894.1 hypothetical protein [Streptomyces scabiei]MDX3250926.1 hypothetical protein [Streptomyces scabiei]MDX3285984.1 hypothetical protein [Streptomyces scabiei]
MTQTVPPTSSTALSSTPTTRFGDPRIAEVGARLDAEVAELLHLMALPVPPEPITA